MFDFKLLESIVRAVVRLDPTALIRRDRYGDTPLALLPGLDLEMLRAIDSCDKDALNASLLDTNKPNAAAKLVLRNCCMGLDMIVSGKATLLELEGQVKAAINRLGDSVACVEFFIEFTLSRAYVAVPKPEPYSCTRLSPQALSNFFKVNSHGI